MNGHAPVIRFLAEFYAPRRKLSKGSIEQHRWVVESLDAWSGDPVRLCDLSTALVSDWLRYLQRRGLSMVTVQNRRRHLLTLWAEAYRAGLVDVAPSVPALSLRIRKNRAYINRGVPGAELKPDMLLRDYVHHYNLKRSLAKATAYQYEVAASSVDSWNGSPVRLDMLCDDLVNRWLVNLESSSMAQATIRGRRRHLIALWHSAIRDGLVSQQKREIRLVRAAPVPPEAWSHAEVCRLLGAAQRLRGCYPSERWIHALGVSVRRAVFWEIMVRVAWDTGLRTGDILKLTISQFNADGTVEFVQSKTTRWHMTRVHAETLRVIKASVAGSRERIVEWFSSREWFAREFAKLVASAGIRQGSFKRLRKSSATEVELHYPGCGAAHLGHVVPGSVAQAHYLDPRLLAHDKPMPRPLVVPKDSMISERGGA